MQPVVQTLLNALVKGAPEREVAKRVKSKTYFGQELVARPRRLALMNLYLHNIGANIPLGDTIYVPPTKRDFDVILTNPPFGTRGANQAPDREDFTVSTSNKQLNFVQHILTVLRAGGRAAVVLPDTPIGPWCVYWWDRFPAGYRLEFEVGES